MRYTTIIDIRPIPLYKSEAARLLYLHMVLASGYHDHDRDLCLASLRSMAADTGLTLSAVRAALKRLEKYGMVSRQGTYWRVTKWVMSEEITKRATSKRQQKEQDAARERAEKERQREEQAEEQRRQREANKAAGTNPLLEYIEEHKRKAEAGDVESLDVWRRHEKIYYEMRAKMSGQK